MKRTLKYRLLIPLRAAARATGVAVRITLGIAGFLLLCGGTLLVSPLNYPAYGLVLCALGLILTIKAIF